MNSKFPPAPAPAQDFSIEQIVNELARRAKIGNSLAYHHARARMDLRHADLETKVRLRYLLAQRAIARVGASYES